MIAASTPGRFAASAHSDASTRRDDPASRGDRDQDVQRGLLLVEAAYELLDNAGLEGLTIRAVLKKTGLARRAFYERFAGKDDLVLAVFAQTIRFAAFQFAEHVSTLSDPMERLKFVVTGFVLGGIDSRALDRERSDRGRAAMSREHLRLAESRPEDLQRALGPLMSLIERLLSEGMDAGVVRRCPPGRLATLVYNLVSTTVHTELLTRESAQPDKARRAMLAAEIWEFCRRAIAA